jgi:potassium channel
MGKYELFCFPQEAWLLPQTYLQYTEQKCEDVSKKVPTLEGDINSTKLASETIQPRMLLQDNCQDESNQNYGAKDGMANDEEDLDAVRINCETETSTEEFRIQIKSEDSDAASSWQTSNETVQLGSSHNTSEGTLRRMNQYYSHKKSTKKRVTIHIYSHNATYSLLQNGKLINLPNSLEDLFETSSK